MNDVNIVKGMAGIINPDNIKPGIDLKELERRMVSGGLIEEVKDPKDTFDDHLRRAAKSIGITFDEIDNRGEDSDDDHYDSEDEPNSRSPSRSRSRSPSRSPPRRSPPLSPPRIYSPPRSPKYRSPGDSRSPSRRRGGPSPSPPSRFNRFDNSREGVRTDSLGAHTEEQRRREHITAVMGTPAGAFSFEKEKREDMKCAMLAEIDSLISELSDDDIDLSRIPRVDKNSPYDEVSSVLKILRHKIDHNHYCSFAEEFLMMGAYGMEELFNGKRTWFNRYQPDLTGWHNNVAVKLKRMRHDTGQVVSGIMSDYNIGPAARIILELIPNMFLHSKTRKQQHDEPGIFSDDEMNAARARIRDSF